MSLIKFSESANSRYRPHRFYQKYEQKNAFLTQEQSKK